MIKYFLILIAIIFISCTSQDSSYYLMIDDKDDLILTEGRVFYVFSSKEKLLEYEKIKNYKPEDMLKSDYKFNLELNNYCPELRLSTTNDTDKIDSKQFEKLNVLDRKTFLEEAKKEDKLYCIKKTDEKTYILYKVNVLSCE